MARKRDKACGCCGGYAGKWRQWFNQDTGYGICARCYDWQIERGEDQETMRRRHGVEGQHWGRTD